MRIVVDLQSCQNASRLRGIGRYAMAITRAMIEAGEEHEFWIALSDRFPSAIAPIRAQLGGLLPPERIVVFSLPARVAGADESAAWRSRAAEALREHFLASLRPDIVFLPSLFEGFWDDCVTSIGRQPIATAVAIHDLIPLVWPNDFVTAPVERACYNRKLLSLKRADLWLAVSDHSRREALDLLDLPADRVLSTSEAADSRFRPARFNAKGERALRDRFGLAQPFVMFTSAIEQRKNVDGLIRAYGALPPEVRADHRLALVGGTEDHIRAHLAAVAAEAGLAPDEIVLTGHVTDEELVGLYSLCRLFVFPSFHEGFGLPVLEAMACGAPVVGSAVTSIPEVLGREDALFDPSDTASMSRLMLKVLTDDAFRASLREHGVLRAREFSWDRSARRALAGFEALLADRRAGSRQEQAAPRLRLAYVTFSAPHGAFAALIAELARHYEIEIVCDGARASTTANLPVRSMAWFEAHAGDFSRILYDCDRSGPPLLRLMSRHPGVLALSSLFPRETRPDLDYGAFLAWLYEMHGYDAMALAAREGRAAAAAAYPLVQDVLADAAGVITASDALREAARPWLGDAEVEAWRRVSLADQSACETADLMAEAIEAFALAGPAAWNARLFADITSECGVGPTDDDLILVARSLAANVRPAGRGRLFVDVSAIAGGALLGEGRREALRQIAALIGEPRLGRRVEPIWANDDGFRLARQVTLEALGLAGMEMADEPAAAFPGDVYLALSPPGFSPGLADLQARGVRILCLATAETRLFAPSVLPVFMPILRGWIDRAASEPGGRLWRPFAAEDGAEPAPRGAALESLQRLWEEGIDIDALVVGGEARDDAPSAIPFEASGWTDLRAALADAAEGEGCDVEGPGDLAFTVRGHVLGTYSLALINRAVARALERAHPGRVRLDPLENGEVRSLVEVPACERAEAEALARRPPLAVGRRVIISQHYPVIAPEVRDGDLSIALTAWEESLTPRAFVEDLSTGFDAVLATSRFTAKALVDSGLRTPVLSIGQPPDISAFETLGRTARPSAEPFVFLHVSSAMPRKGVDVLLAAWGRAFERSDPVRLVIKTFPNPHNDMADRLAAFARRFPRAAEIQLINSDLGQSELVRLYAHANAVVSPSRGEGYNLPALEAMAAGIPVIVTGCGGHRDFCGPGEARLLRYHLERSKSHVSASHGLWAEPDEDDLVAALREMVDPAEAPATAARVERARRAALAAASPSRWVGRLEEVVARLSTGWSADPPRTVWITSWNIRCGIAEYSRLLLEAFSPAARERTTILTDARTPANASARPPTAPAWTLGAPGAWLGIAEAIGRADPEAVVIQHQDGLLPWPELTSLLEDRQLAARVTVVVLHNAVQLASRGEGEQALVARGLRRASRVLVHTLADANLLLRLGLEDNITLLPHGAARTARTPQVRDLTAPSAAPIIGCHGFFLPGKGIDRLIRACAVLRRTWPGLTLRLVNARFPAEVSDEEIERCRAIARDLDFGEAIDWRTDFLPQDEISRVLADCDLIVLAYDQRSDSASGAVRGALASLTPVAVTEVEIFQELGDAVARLPSNAPEAMAPALEVLLQDAERRRAIQARAVAWLAAHAWPEVAFRLEGMIHGLVAADRLMSKKGSAGLLAPVG